MNVLFTCVGERDPIPMQAGQAGEGSIVTLCRRLSPDVVLLLPTGGYVEGEERRSSTLEHARLTQEYLEKEVSQSMEIRMEPLDVSDPRDYGALLQTMRQAVSSFLVSQSDEITSLVNISSGTPQQQAVWLLLVSGGLLPRPRLYQVADPRFVPEEGRVREVSFTFFEEESLASRATRAISDGWFGAAADLLERLAKVSVSPERQDSAQAAARLLRAYHAWDRYAFREAYERIRAVQRNVGQTKFLEPIHAWLQAQVDVLRVLSSSKDESKETPEKLLDLYWNAARCVSRGSYADGLARVWRLLEGSFYILLREAGVEPVDLERSRSAEAVRQVRDMIGSEVQQLTLYTAQKALEALGHQEWQRWKESRLEGVRGPSEAKKTPSWAPVREHIVGLRKLRNESYVAHGMRPVGWSEAETGLRLAGSALETLLKIRIDDYPLSNAMLADLANRVARMIP